MGKLSKADWFKKQQGVLLEILHNADAYQCWQVILNFLLQAACEISPGKLHQFTVNLDRLLSEAAWNLWSDFPSSVPNTANSLHDWWENNCLGGRAVLVLDALSLQELQPLLVNARLYGLEPVSVKVTAAEIPTDTDSFAGALGVASRASLYNNGVTDSFLLGGKSTYTDVLKSPFQDCMGDVTSDSDILLWHCWLDDLIHLYKREPQEIENSVRQEFSEPGFWQLVNKLRQGRKLIITSDHGYANCKMFSTEETEEPAKGVLTEFFGASRYCEAKSVLPVGFMPPLALTFNNHHVVLGQRRWKVQGGYPHLAHGGLTVLEALVPFIEFTEV